MANVFVDSTTLLYTIDPTEPVKRDTARDWLRRLRQNLTLTLSLQVLNETFWVASRKPVFAPVRAGLKSHLTGYEQWTTAPLDMAALREAWDLQDRYRTSFWDSLMLASANRAGCRYFLSEDLNDGQVYGGVTAVNPFRHAPEDVLGRALPI